jgi:chemotaxis response regulator CheB
VVKAFGGTVLVQDPITASEPGMPRAAISTGCSDFVLSPDRIADALTTLTMVPGAASLFLS